MVIIRFGSVEVTIPWDFDYRSFIVVQIRHSKYALKKGARE